jgi:hypothetical protein
MNLVRSFVLCLFIYVFCCNEIMNDLNFFAIIETFHVHYLFRYDGIDNEWSKPCMLAQHSHTFKKLP